jgi:hypothetical protein
MEEKSMKNLKTLGKHNYGRPKKQEKKCGSGEKLTGVHARSTSRTFLLPPAEPSPGAWRYSLTSDLPPNERVGSLQGLAEGRGCRDASCLRGLLAAAAGNPRRHGSQIAVVTALESSGGT